MVAPAARRSFPKILDQILKNSAIFVQYCSITTQLWEGVAPALAMFKELLSSTKAVYSPVEPVSPSPGNRTAIATLGTISRTHGVNGEAYPVADFVGRCFLRLCFWFDFCTSWTRRYGPPAFTATAKAHPVQVSTPPKMMAATVLEVGSASATRHRTES